MVLGLNKDDILKIKKISNIIEKNKNFLITTHQNSDGDAIGSELAMFLFLKKLNKNVKIVNYDKVPSIYKFLPSVNEVSVYNKKTLKNNFDVIIIIDCSSTERTIPLSYNKKNTSIVNIDHHINNFQFGNLNWINPEFSATGEMIYFIIEKFKKLDRSIAACLYTAIITDTGRFTYQMSKFTMDIVKNLIEYKIMPVEIATKIYLEKPYKSVKLLSLALGNLKFDFKNKVCWMKITRQLYKKTNTDEEFTEGFIDFLAEIKESEIVFLMKEKEDGIKVSLRSKEKFDVEKLARKFGGGGHKKASGCFFKNKKIEEVEKTILNEIRKNGRNYKYK